MSLTYKAGNGTAPEHSVPPGDYTLRVIDAAEDTSKEGNDMIRLRLRVIHDDDGREGPVLFDYLVITPKAAWKIDQFLAACGHAPDEGEEVHLDVGHMIGWECRAELAETAWQNRKNNKVLNYLLPDPGF